VVIVVGEQLVNRLEELLDRLDLRRPLWHAKAACAGVDPEVFLPARGASHDGALAYCERCEVRAECLQFAPDQGDNRCHGVWGGVSYLARRRARRRGWDAARLIAELDR
jgi:WhiB family transcriptional regulator, redox-sensing transcriptional regulator